MGEVMPDIAEYAGGEFNQAHATCLALKSKSAIFKGELKGQKFSFELEHRNCTGAPAITSFKTTLMEDGAGKLVYADGPVNSYFKVVETHNEGILAGVCDAILRGNSTANTYTTATETTQVRFTEENDILKVIAYTTAPSPEGGAAIVREDVLTVNLGGNSQGSIVGLVLEKEQRVPCPGGGVEILRQTYLNHNIY